VGLYKLYFKTSVHLGLRQGRNLSQLLAHLHGLRQLALLKFLLLLLAAAAAVEMGGILIGAAVHWHGGTILRLPQVIPTIFMLALVVQMPLVGLLILLIFLLPLLHTEGVLALVAHLVSVVKVVVKAAQKVTMQVGVRVVILVLAALVEMVTLMVMLVLGVVVVVVVVQQGS
jgi:hypothetical protein